MMDGKTPLVSVVCLCYNHEKTVAQAIESVISQKAGFGFELIIHDDASTDKTPEIIARYASLYPDIIVPVLQSENRMKNCNIAETYIAPLLRGRLIAICEGDDFWTSDDKLASQAAVMLKDPEITMCFHGVNQLESNNGSSLYRPLKSSRYADPGLIVKRGGMFCPSVSIMVRRDIADMWPDFRRAADVYDYPLQVLAAANGRVYYLDKIMASYRFAHKGSWTESISLGNDFGHIDNEISWLSMFNDYTSGRFRGETDYHFAHLWLTEYRKTLKPELRKKALESAKKLKLRDKTVFFALILMFSVLGKKGEALYGFIKKLILK